MTQNEKTDGRPQAGWRFYFGTFFFVLGLVCPLFIPLVTAMNLPAEMKTTLSGALFVGIPQLFSLTAIAFLGRSGFKFIRGKLFAAIRKLGPPREVSRTRYRIGLVMFTVPLLVGWLAPYAVELIPVYAQHRAAVAIAGDLVLIASLFVLGGEFWEKVRALFIYDAKAQALRSQSG